MAPPQTPEIATTLDTQASGLGGSMPLFHLDIDYNQLQDKVITAAIMPVNYVWEVQLYYKLIFIFTVLVICGFLYPMIVYITKWIKAICHPITFPYKHVLITGCGTGLGKALV